MTTGWKQSQPGPPGRAVQAGAPVAASPLRASRNWQVGGQWPSGWGGEVAQTLPCMRTWSGTGGHGPQDT